VLSAPAYLGELLGLAPTQFFWLFIFTISGIMAGAWLVPPTRNDELLEEIARRQALSQLPDDFWPPVWSPV
jgi:hypothetical protein